MWVFVCFHLLFFTIIFGQLGCLSLLPVCRIAHRVKIFSAKKFWAVITVSFLVTILQRNSKKRKKILAGMIL
jgi:glucan phosphoethanolaminetransferase (alkaline phosphatase superfamily)